jgi:nucleotide-binding universal stress UspA family protein
MQRVHLFSMWQADEHDIDALWRGGADLVASGAYGHARAWEWAFGGFTRSLLTRSQQWSYLVG